MTCVEITHEMAALLVALGSRPQADLEALRALPEWRFAQNWGWLTESSELTPKRSSSCRIRGHARLGGSITGAAVDFRFLQCLLAVVIQQP